MELHDVFPRYMEKISTKYKVQSTMMHHFFGSHLLIACILLVAAYQRLYNISGYMTFLGDEGRDVLIVKRMIVDHKFTLLGPTASVGGFFLGPIYYYFMLPFLWAWKLDPTGPAVMVALFGVGTVYLLYRFGKELFEPLVGLIAASLFSVSPVVIAYSRSSWNPNIVPFFSLLLFYSCWKALHIGSVQKKYLLIAGVSLGIGLQLHYLFLFLIPVVLLWFFLYGKKSYICTYLLYILMGFGVGYAPFLLFEIRHGFPNTQTVIRFIFEGKDTGFTSQKYFTIIMDVIRRLFGRFLLREPQPEIWEKLPIWQFRLWFTGIAGMITASLGVTVFALFHRTKQRKALSLVALWLFIPLVLFGFYKKGIYDYYFGIFSVVPFLLVAYTFTQLRVFLWGKWVMAVLWAGLLLFNWQGRPFLYPPNNQLANVRLVAKEIFTRAENKPLNFALITDGNSDHAYRYFLELWGNKPVTIETFESDPERKTVMDQLLVICESSDCKPLGHPLWEIAGFGRAEIVGMWDIPFVKLFKLVHYTGDV